MNKEFHRTRARGRLQFCALEYNSALECPALLPADRVILLVVRDEEGGLQLLVHPEWRKSVRKEDSAYIGSLLKDFLERAELHPEELFQHLCSLTAGPLITQEAGSHLGEYPHLLKLLEEFVLA